MANVGKNRLVKVIFTNIHKINDACANNFGRYIMIAMKLKYYYFLLNSSYSGVSEKIKAHLSQHSPALQQLFSPHLFNFIQRNCQPHPHLKEGRDYVFYRRDYKGETIKLLPFYMTDFLFTEL